MTTSALKVGDLLSLLGTLGIEKQLMRLDGVSWVSVNPVVGKILPEPAPGQGGHGGSSFLSACLP
jgi:hypothetical protein